ncbi:MAG: ketohexokinase [Gammaproteobacteria bacterium]|nr:MAG: ketohexokinase [Gammaproteobacteria bacterium]
MSCILICGIATLDIINSVDAYPAEDDEVRARQQSVRYGGNAANTATVLSQLHHHIDFIGTLAADMAGEYIAHELGKHHVQLEHAVVIPNATTPTSYITLNTANGSRTIVHYRDLPELNFTDFDRLSLDHYDWCHFEGRNCSQTRVMMQKVQQQGIPRSVELEKERDDIDSLIPLADVIMLSRPFARGRGFDSAEACIQHFAELHPDKRFTCTWGTEGAWGWDQQLLHSPAFVPVQVVDTLGAGDTFNAALIHALVTRQSLSQALEYACQLAGNKCAQQGFDNLGLIHD